MKLLILLLEKSNALKVDETSTNIVDNNHREGVKTMLSQIKEEIGDLKSKIEHLDQTVVGIKESLHELLDRNPQPGKLILKNSLLQIQGALK